MTLIRRPSPFSELVTLRQAMDRLFDEPFFRPVNGFTGETALPLDVRSTPDALEIRASLPGVKPEDVDITVENGTLSIRGESRSDVKEGEGEYLVREITRGTFTRAITLPTGLEADKAEATFENGVLTLRIPKAEQVKPRQIRISPVTAGTAERTGGSEGPTPSGSSSTGA